MKNGKYTLIIAPSEWKGKKYRNRYCYEHHYIWWMNTGEYLTESEVIHHINGITIDNRFENLKKLNKYDHKSLHGSERPINMVKLKCPNPECQQTFYRPRNNTHLCKKNNSITCCSRRCSGKTTHLILNGKLCIEELIRCNVIEEFTVIKRVGQ